MATERTKESSAIHNTKHVRLKSSHAKTSNVFDHNIVATAKMIAAIVRTKSVAPKRRTQHVPPANSLARTVNASTINWFATKWPIAVTNPTSHCIATWTNVPKWKSINAATNASTLSPATTVIAIKATNYCPMERLVQISTNVWKHQASVLNTAQTRQAVITANATNAITNARMMNTRASERTTSSHGLYSRTNTIYAICLSMAV